MAKTNMIWSYYCGVVIYEIHSPVCKSVLLYFHSNCWRSLSEMLRCWKIYEHSFLRCRWTAPWAGLPQPFHYCLSVPPHQFNSQLLTMHMLILLHPLHPHPWHQSWDVPIPTALGLHLRALVKMWHLLLVPHLALHLRTDEFLLAFVVMS